MNPLVQRTNRNHLLRFRQEQLPSIHKLQETLFGNVIDFNNREQELVDKGIDLSAHKLEMEKLRKQNDILRYNNKRLRMKIHSSKCSVEK